MSPAFWSHAFESPALAFLDLDAGVLLPAVVAEAVAAVHSSGLLGRHVAVADCAELLISCMKRSCC